MADKSSKGTSRSAKYYQNNPTAKAKKQAYDKKANAKPAAKKYRRELIAENRKRGTNGNGDGKDVSHKKGGGTTLEKKSSNRARQGSGGKAKKK
jgi:hypothetical protein